MYEYIESRVRIYIRWAEVCAMKLTGMNSDINVTYLTDAELEEKTQLQMSDNLADW